MRPSLTLQQALLQGMELLAEGAIHAPRLTAEVLLAHALRRDRTYLYAHSDEPLSEVAWIHFGRYLHERLKGKPTQYITHRQEFWGREFRVTHDVLIPRPETEHLVEAALAHIKPGDRVLDVGTGSGAIAITLALECQARVYGSDVSIPALRAAEFNGRRLKAAVNWFAGDLADAVAPQSIDVLVSNPPYVPWTDEPGLQREVRDWEPRLALFGGPTGVEMYERLIAQAAGVLRSGGWLAFELGYNSLDRVREMLGEPWKNQEMRQDLAGFPRVLTAQWSG